MLESIAPIIHREGGAIDVHLMVDDPEHYFGALQTAGADSVTFHLEAVSDPQAVAAQARERGFQVGLAIKPETDVQDAADAAAGFDLVLCMSIHPGYSGQEFMPGAIDRIRRLRSALPAADPSPGRRRDRERQHPQRLRRRRRPVRLRVGDLRDGRPAARHTAGSFSSWHD